MAALECSVDVAVAELEDLQLWDSNDRGKNIAAVGESLAVAALGEPRSC